MLLKAKFNLKADISQAGWEGPSHSLSHQDKTSLAAIPTQPHLPGTWTASGSHNAQSILGSSGNTQPCFESTVTHRGVGV